MYELIMDLPLFKGISRDHVSTLVEKNHVVFESFCPGDEIVAPGRMCLEIRFIVRGSANVTVKSSHLDVSISQTLTTGAVIGADALYGISPNYIGRVVAKDNVSLLKFTKEVYFRLLQQDSIYLMNYLNYLSRGLQTARDAIREFPSHSVRGLLGAWVTSMTEPFATDITVQYRPEHLAQLCGLTAQEVEQSLHSLSDEGLLTADNGVISGIRRRELLDSLDVES